jgi:hypothetical protein
MVISPWSGTFLSGSGSGAGSVACSQTVRVKRNITAARRVKARRNNFRFITLLLTKKRLKKRFPDSKKTGKEKRQVFSIGASFRWKDLRERHSGRERRG